MVLDIGNVVLLDNGKIGIVHSFLYERKAIDSLNNLHDFMDFPPIIGVEGVDFDGHYWSSNNLNLKVLAISLDDYNNNTTFHHPV